MGRRKKQAPARPDEPAGMATGAEAVEVGGGSGPPGAVNGASLPRADAVSSCKDKPCCSSEKKKEAVEEAVAPKTSCKDKPCCSSEKKKEAVEEVVTPKTSCKDKPCCSSEKKKEAVEEAVAPKTSCKDKPCCTSDNDAVVSKPSCGNKASEQKSSCSGSVGKVAGDNATGCCAVKKGPSKGSIHESALSALRYSSRVTMDVLVSLSATCAYMFSVVTVILQVVSMNRSGQAHAGGNGSIQPDHLAPQEETFFEVTSLLVTLILLGRYIEKIVKAKAARSVDSLLQMQAKTAILLEAPKVDAQVVSQPSSDELSAMTESYIDVLLVERGDLLKVLPGARVPTDGVVIDGSSRVDESMITGEARKVDKEVGSIVIGGTINAHGVLTVRVTHTINESMLARIVHLVDDAQAMKSRTEGLADAVSSYFTTFIICVAAVAFCDTPRPEARLVVEELRARKIQTWIVTGDQRETALAVAESLGIPDVTVIADALPHDKVDKVRLLQGIGKRVAFIGDGVNDGPALAMADVGVALGAGTDVALESADLVLVKDDLRDLLNAWDLSRATNRLIRWNFTWGFLYNFAMMPLACGALYPFFGLIIPPAFAGLSELLSSVPVILFSLLLNLWRPPFQDAKTDTLDARDETVITISGSNLSSSGGSQSSGPFAGVERSNVSETTPLLGSK
ncbi:hypothetical protein ATCC90586_001165 [Pythium insidiosum]|nr:hypothetical protein ATCC90586_001165 [Pythium insidiosum]